MNTIGLAADHAGFAYKEEIKKHLVSQGYIITDFGTHHSESIDYPDVAHPLAIAVEKGKVTFGIALCGSGNGMIITLNKYQDVRSALCWNSEIATLARLHNDANICALPARFITIESALEVVKAFLTTPFEGGRHQRRVAKIPC
jgi:ribose 5-phosphate isomerase B